MMQSYLLADDLSGALEAGAAFSAVGWKVMLPLGTNQPIVGETGRLDVVSTETRSAGPAEAAETVRRIVANRKAAGERLLFKKIDSTLRGPLGAEVGALIAELAPPLVVVCPASPAVGRTVCNGLLHVHGVPVAATEFRYDPGWPVTDSSIENALGSGGVRGIYSLSLAKLRRGSLPAVGSGRRVLVSDAQTDEDLRRLVGLILEREPRALFVGAGGLARALAARLPVRIEAKPTDRATPRSILFVSGSMSPRSRRQVEFLRDECAVPLHEIALEPATIDGVAARVGRSLAERGFASLAMINNLRKADRSGPVRQLTAVLVKLAESGSLPEMLAATGGETAQALCVALGISRLGLMHEIESGVIITTVADRERGFPKWMTIKPGGFGSDRVWCNLIPNIAIQP